MPLGVDESGKRRIEGLLPDDVRSHVYADNPDLVSALSGSTEERRSADRELKKRLLERFKATAQPGEKHYGRFYPVVRIINRVLGDS